MFADQDFADFSQEIGLASLGASDEDVQKVRGCEDRSDELRRRVYGITALITGTSVVNLAATNFATISNETYINLLLCASLRSSQLAWCYWHSVEFGLCKEDGEYKAYGAGLLNSFGELEYACADYRPAGGTEERPELKPWDPAVAGVQEFPITTYQPIYFVAESLNDAKSKMRSFCEGLKKPFLSR